MKYNHWQKVRKGLYIGLGILFVFLGLVGIFFPVLPTTPFLLLAAFFFARSSRRAHHWLLHNRWFGSYIRNYREGRGMALPDKIITLLLLWLTIGATIFLLLETLWLQLLLVVIASGVTFHLLSIHTYRPQRDSIESEMDVE